MINVDFADVRTVMQEMGMAMMGTGRATGDNRARDAAEAAIRSPLLEDVDLHGARGILVNVTAGPDLNIGEFTDVGNVIDEFASEQATVVVGTVIDPNMSDEIKVTVVATGLGMPEKPNVIVDNMLTNAAMDGQVDYARLDRPAYARHNAVLQQDNLAEDLENQNLDYLDIPAFLRRQAD